MTTTYKTNYDKTFPIKAQRPRVFDALTQPEHLQRWFAEHVEIEPRAGGAFKFWGRHTFLVPDRPSAQQVIKKFVRPEAIVFSWNWHGTPGAVALELAESRNETSLRIVHSLEKEFAAFEHESLYLRADFWRTAVGNLQGYLATGKPALLPDYTAGGGGGMVELEIEIDAPVEKVMAALTDPKQMDQWLAKKAAVDLRAGGEYSFGWTTTRDGKTVHAGPHRILEFVPNRKLVHDWTYHNEQLTRVCWELQPLGVNRTRVVLTHDRFDEPKVWSGYVQGWASFLVELKHFGETGVPTPKLEAPTAAGS